MTLTPMKAIRARCLDCSGQQPSEVRNCAVKNCALWSYRMGHRPTTVAKHLAKKGTKEDETATN